MNLPNLLTLFRLVLAAIFVACLSLQFPGHNITALVLFLAASLTDYLDGEIARRMNLITDFGKLMDPLADKILTASAFICLITFGLVPAWVVIVIISREFLITGLRLLASSKGVILPAEKLGKHKTAWQMITIIYYLGLLAFAEWFTSFSLKRMDMWLNLGHILTTIAAVLTVYSGLAYFWKNRRLIQSA
jgi:CDP-diacylglycerol---glycerol-3-phosphate 3-phosphatidyltransferase